MLLKLAGFVKGSLKKVEKYHRIDNYHLFFFSTPFFTEDGRNSEKNSYIFFKFPNYSLLF